MPVPHTSSAPRLEAECVGVLLPLPLAEPYDYRVPDDLVLGLGDIVEVPLGGRRVPGVVWSAGGNRVAKDRLREVIRRFDLPPLPAVLRRFVEWVANYTLSPPGAVLRMVINVPAALEPVRPVTGYRFGSIDPESRPGEATIRMTAARQRVLTVLGDGPARPGRELAREAAVSPGVVQGLVSAGLLQAVALPPPPCFDPPDCRCPGPSLSTEQQSAANALRRCATAGGFGVTLLDGVTGSGKTEVYFEAVAAALAAGHQVLVLLPEIVLSAQWLERFRARFGANPVEWHSDLTGAQRRAAWRAVACGEAKVVVGARSALFLPFPELGLIVVDEEHEAAFKQEEGVIYQARDMAVVRARLTDIPIVLASATPSLETLGNVEVGRYARLHLPERHGVAVLPEMHLIDMRDDPPPSGRWLSPTLRTALAETLAAGEQAMLFLNRRGYAPLTLCRACGYRLQCPQCTAWLVEHRLAHRLQCHHCGYEAQPPQACPDCKADDSFVACGPGVERVAEEVQANFPGARYAIMASDTVAGPRAIEALVHQVTAHEIDLLIGTQIMAKGHHFPLLTLVGVVDADLGLAGGDLRAAERTYQMLSQVAGRAGRADHPGRVYLQTYMPESPVMRALADNDRDRFLAAEAAARRDRGLPPYGRLAAVIVSGVDAAAVESTARALGRAAPRGAGVEVLGPAPAPLSLLRGRYRQRLLMKAERAVNLQALARAWLAAARRQKGVRVQIDVDPYSFL